MRFLKLYEEFNVGESEISDLDKYLHSMQKSMRDKLFWTNKINPDVIVDFGTADGATLESLSKVKPDVDLVGYDIDETMIKTAKSKLKDKAVLTDSWSDVLNIIKDYERPMILLSSVIHEVYSYSSGVTIKNFWENQVFGSGFKWVVIRDMMPTIKSEKLNDIEAVKSVKSKAKPEVLRWFESEWGDIGRDYRNLIHFLLKYRYEENFDREMKENYVPVSFETVKKKIPSNYKIKYEDHYILPFLKGKVKEDFGINLKYPTHAKLIIEKI